ncbi:chemotaxis protein CheX [Clostridium sp. D2Q-11]|uniref:Chemotaxis protein CheX n=1 Tax=Anaeromonas frigoriresistens TaxID=2683708 RepID=A0A942Z802_9FIRM|nr:chemotaxis protein CheX [Anaeromonas frigoriresistens]MBS4537788.1 chemotaxis protein CheX [Anaeromonas frigoriresistens]
MGINNNINSKIIKSFKKALEDIFLQMVNIQLNSDSNYLTNQVNAYENVIILIGINGDFKGQVAIELSHNIAMEISSNMMNGLPNIIFDDNVKNSINELISIVLGNAISRLFELNIHLNFTPPTIIMGKDILLYFINNKIYSIPFLWRNDKVELYIDLE